MTPLTVKQTLWFTIGAVVVSCFVSAKQGTLYPEISLASHPFPGDCASAVA